MYHLPRFVKSETKIKRIFPDFRHRHESITFSFSADQTCDWNFFVYGFGRSEGVHTGNAAGREHDGFCFALPFFLSDQPPGRVIKSTVKKI